MSPGFDGTPSGEDALALARVCARVLDTALVVATVHPSPALIGAGRVDAEWVADRHQQSSTILDGARKLLAGLESVEYRLVASSSAAHGLHDLADELGASVIVVGTRRVGDEPRLFAGSTADRLLAGSRLAVGIAPPDLRHRDLGGALRFGVAYVDTPDGQAALALAVRFAAPVGASLTLYSVLADVDAVDVLFCGSRGYGPARRVLLGGVSSRLVRQARSPVIVVPRG